MVYWVEIKDSQIINKGISQHITNNQIEVTEEIYNQIGNYRAEYEMDGDSKIITVTPIPKPPTPPQEPEPTTEEILLEALLEIQALKNKVTELEGKLDA